jgi:DNA primase
VIAEIRERTDMVELVGGYLNLKRAGRNFVGLCPFHQEKTPSFNVSPDRQIYHCFGCGVTGDAFRFLMEHDHLSFPEAIRTLAERAGVDLKPFETGRTDAASEFDLLYKAHAIAVRLYRETLGAKEGEAAREEIARRSLSRETIEKYRVGAAPGASDTLVAAARREGIRPDVLMRAGLALERNSGEGFYDRFRARLMFPIEAVGGKVIGFGGRVLGEGEPKYLNSPESALFRKRKTLYGFPQAQAAVRERREAILVEGYTDVLSLASAGLEGVVASLGTAFTVEHAQFLARSCDKVTVLFDGDEAGRRATHASCAPLLGAGLLVKIVTLPEGSDPDSFVRERGVDALRELIRNAKGVIETILSSEPYYEGGAPQERAIRRVLQVLAPIRDPVRRKVYLEELSVTAGVRSSLPEEMLAAELAELHKKEAAVEARAAARGEAAAARGEAAEESGSPHQRPSPAAIVVSERLPAVERTFVAILTHESGLASTLLQRFGPEAFEHELVRRIVAKASEIHASEGSISAARLLGALEDEPSCVALLGRLAVSEQYTVELERQAEDCLARMERRQLEREMKEITVEMRKAKARGDEEQVQDCARKKNELARELAMLGTPRS